MRTFTWPPEFCRILETEIRRQATFPEFDTPNWYQDTVEKIYSKFPR